MDIEAQNQKWLDKLSEAKQTVLEESGRVMPGMAIVARYGDAVASPAMPAVKAYIAASKRWERLKTAYSKFVRRHA